MSKVFNSLAWAWILAEAFGGHARAAAIRLRSLRIVRRVAAAAARYLSDERRS